MYPQDVAPPPATAEVAESDLETELYDVASINAATIREPSFEGTATLGRHSTERS